MTEILTTFAIWSLVGMIVILLAATAVYVLLFISRSRRQYRAERAAWRNNRRVEHDWHKKLRNTPRLRRNGNGVV